MCPLTAVLTRTTPLLLCLQLQALASTIGKIGFAVAVAIFVALTASYFVRGSIDDELNTGYDRDEQNRTWREEISGCHAVVTRCSELTRLSLSSDRPTGSTSLWW